MASSAVLQNVCELSWLGFVTSVFELQAATPAPSNSAGRNARNRITSLGKGWTSEYLLGITGSHAKVEADGDGARIRIDESIVDAARQRIAETKNLRIPVRVLRPGMQVLHVEIDPRRSCVEALGQALRQSIPENEVLEARVITLLDPPVRDDVTVCRARRAEHGARRGRARVLG